MVDTLASPLGDPEELTQAVHDELLALRHAPGRLTVEKFSQFPHLRRVCGDGDVLVAYLMFERELQRFIRRGNRYEAAAALSLLAPQDTVLARFEEVLGHFQVPDGPDSDRTARRWSNRGMKAIAVELVHLADVQIRLGSELTTIELSGTYEDGVFMEMYQLTTRHTEERAPLVRVWHYQPDDTAEQDNTIEHDLDQVESQEGNKGPFRLRLFTFKLDRLKGLHKAPVKAGETVYRFTIEGRDAPLRAVSFQDGSDLSDFFTVRFTTYLTDANLEMSKRASESS